MSLISIVIPTFNEALNVPVIYSEILNVLSASEYQFEIIYVDDGSTDDSLLKIKELAGNDNKVKYISFSRNFGHQAALRAGLRKAKGHAVVSLDCDMQQPPSLIIQMIEKWEGGYDIVYTIRKSTSGNIGFFKQFTSKIFYSLINILSNVEIKDGAADFRLLDSKVVATVNSLTEHDIFFRGMISWLGYNSINIEYIAAERLHGKSSYTLSKMIKLAISGITSFSTKPLIISIYIGLLTSLITFLYFFYVLYIKFFTTNAVSGWASVIISVLFIGGIQLISLGVIGQYIAKIYDECRGRPKFITKEEN